MLHSISCPATQLVLADQSHLSTKTELLTSTSLCHILFAALVMDLEETDHKWNSLGTVLHVIHMGGNWLWQR